MVSVKSNIDIAGSSDTNKYCKCATITMIMIAAVMNMEIYIVRGVDHKNDSNNDSDSSNTGNSINDNHVKRVYHNENASNCSFDSVIDNHGIEDGDNISATKMRPLPCIHRRFNPRFGNS